MKSQGGGGFASHAAIDLIENKIYLVGVTWNAHFLKRWRFLTVNGQEDDSDADAYTDASATDYPLCFVGTIQLPQAASFQTPKLSDSNAGRGGTTFCQSISLLHGNTALLLGYQLKPNPTNPGQTASVQRVLKNLSLQTQDTNELQLSSTAETDTSQFIYPMGMTTDARAKGQPHNVFLALTQSTQVPPMFHLDSMAADAEDTGAPLSVLQPKFWFRQLQEMLWIRTGEQTSLEASTTGGVQKINVDGQTSEWYIRLAGEPGFEGDVMATHVAYAPSTRHGEFLLVAGSAKGASGPLLGTVRDIPLRGGLHDWDGFLTKIDPQTGEKVTPSSHSASYRIQSAGNKHDWVTALCFQDRDMAYIIGSTRGKVASSPTKEDGGAFIIKIDVDDMTIQWRIQLEGMGVLGTACAIVEEEIQAGSNSKNLLYVAGTLPPSHPGLDLNGNKDASKSGRHRASQDAFVVAIDVDSSNGQIEWIREIEYEDEASLPGAQARHEHIFSLVLDSNQGHVIAFGNSYDPSFEGNDVFAVALDVQYGTAGDLAGISHEAGKASSSNSSSSTSDEESKSNLNQGQDGNSSLSQENGPISGVNLGNGTIEGGVKIDIVVVAVLLPLSILVFIIIMHFYCPGCRRHHHHQKSLRENEKMEPVSYLAPGHFVVEPGIQATNPEEDKTVPQSVSVYGHGSEADPPGVTHKLV